jgi:hypothetical protein
VSACAPAPCAPAPTTVADRSFGLRCCARQPLHRCSYRSISSPIRSTHCIEHAHTGGCSSANLSGSRR